MGLQLCLALAWWRWLFNGGKAKVYCCCGERVTMTFSCDGDL